MAGSERGSSRETRSWRELAKRGRAAREAVLRRALVQIPEARARIAAIEVAGADRDSLSEHHTVVPGRNAGPSRAPDSAREHALTLIVKLNRGAHAERHDCESWQTEQAKEQCAPRPTRGGSPVHALLPAHAPSREHAHPCRSNATVARSSCWWMVTEHDAARLSLRRRVASSPRSHDLRSNAVRIAERTPKSHELALLATAR